MNGAEALIASAVESGIEICFANPGTTEMPMVLALDNVPGIRGVLCLHENVATGAADGYGRMIGKPAMCLLHLGPGLANGLTNLHNARRAATPILNVIGEHATWHLEANPLLATDIERVAGIVCNEVHRCRNASGIAGDVAQAIARASANGGRIATLIVPHDLQTAIASGAVSAAAPPKTPAFDASNVRAAAAALKHGKSALFLGGTALSENGLKCAGRIAAATGADLMCETFFARMERGRDLPAPARLPYFPDEALALTRPYEHVLLVGARRPVAFFGYPETPSYLTTEQQTVPFARAEDDVMGALSALAAEVGAGDTFENAQGAPPDPPKGPLNATTVSHVIAALQPENAIVMDEALTVGVPYFAASAAAPRFTHLMLTGGAIGQGPGAATGAALACPDRKVINFQSDGCGAYSVQAFWTQARENLNVVTIIGSNRSYNILNVELLRAGIGRPGPIARSMANLDKPYLDWVKIAEGFGVPSVAVDTAKGLAREFERALATTGPRLIEAIMA